MFQVIGAMVQTYQSPVRVYKYPFEIVMAVSDAGFIAPDSVILKVLMRDISNTSVTVSLSTLHADLLFIFE